MDRETTLVSLFERLDRERQVADRKYNDALTALDQALQTIPELPAPPSFADRSEIERLNAGWKIATANQWPADRSLKGRLRTFVWRVIAPTIEAQQRFNAAVVEHINRNTAVHEQATHAVAALVEAARRELEALVRFEWLLLQLLQSVTAYVDTKDRSGGGPEIREHLALIQQRLVMVERELARGIERRPAVEERDSASTQLQAAPEPRSSAPFSGLGSATYLGFEDRFRGTAQSVRERLAPYVPLLTAAADVVDIGCGRGELLDLLRQHGVKARGIDMNQAMVDECRSKGLAAERADAVTFLAHQQDATLGGMIAIQVVEHFEPSYLMRFLELAYQKLRPDAPFVLETLNPACWMAFFECYIRDLTHARPLHPDTLRYLVQATGFKAVNVEYRQAVTEADRLERVAPSTVGSSNAELAAALNAHADKLNARLFSSMDYAVIARR